MDTNGEVTEAPQAVEKPTEEQLTEEKPTGTLAPPHVYSRDGITSNV